MSKFSQGNSSALLPSLAVYHACLKALESVATARAGMLERYVAKVQARRWKWVVRLIGPMSRHQALRIISNTPGFQDHKVYAWGIIEVCERIAALSLAVMPNGIMCVTARDFECFASYYKPEGLPWR